MKNGFSDITKYSPGESDDEHLKGVGVHGGIVPSKFNDMETMVVEFTKPNVESERRRAQSTADA